MKAKESRTVYYRDNTRLILAFILPGCLYSINCVSRILYVLQTTKSLQKGQKYDTELITNP